ncbi:hypothetical protein ACIQC5_10160 [Paenarthrobacter sp. NPDC092416]|uniref:hypothetical protein n=1 Tax=Paenarthrobacter sp. NPDC092416 TaxID=3364386 RepID=UPI0038028AF9
MEQPILVTSIRRPWHRGIAVVTGPGQTEDFPEIEPDRPFCSTSGALVIMVRHAQDIDDIDLGFAEVTVSIALHQNEVVPEAGYHAVGGGVLSTPEGTLSVGDADMEVVVPAQKGITQFRVSVADPAESSPEHVRVDLWPSGTS